MSTQVSVATHDTPAELYSALARVFTETAHEGHRWVAIEVSDVRLTFYAPREPVTAAEAS